MSEMCLINLREPKYDEKKFKKIYKELLLLANENQFTILPQFNICQNLILEEHLNTYFVLSDESHSLIKGGVFSQFNLQPLIIEFLKENQSEYVFKNKFFEEAFIEKFKFFNKILDSIFANGAEIVEIFVANNVSEIIGSSDFDLLETTKNRFLYQLFYSIYDFCGNGFNYVIPNIKFIIRA